MSSDGVVGSLEIISNGQTSGQLASKNWNKEPSLSLFQEEHPIQQYVNPVKSVDQYKTNIFKNHT